MTNKYVFYHANCNDGFGAAVAAWKYFGSIMAQYIPIQYDSIQEVIGGLKFEEKSLCDVYFVDFCPDAQTINNLASFHNVYIIDHHKTAKPVIDAAVEQWPNVRAHFSMDKSGARLAWEYFFPRTMVPNLIKFIEDRDLWNFVYGADTRTLFHALNIVDRAFPVWNRLLDNNSLSKLINKYRHLEDYIEMQVDRIAESAIEIDWQDGYDIIKARFVVSPVHASEVGNRIMEMFDSDVALVLNIERPDKIKVSARSRKGGYDVSELAKRFGGGGHQAAAGFYVDSLELFGGKSVKPKRVKKTNRRGKSTKESG